MKVSTRGRYGLKAMVDIALNSSESSCVNLKSVAQRQGISENYLEQLISALKKANIVKSIRGAQGGYILSSKPSEITVGDILRAVEGPLELVDCISEKDSASCGNANCSKCVTKNVWEKMSESINDAADSISLQNLIDEHKEM